MLFNDRASIVFVCAHCRYQKYLDLTSDWHVFTLDWLVDRMVMYIDNELVGLQSDSDFATSALIRQLQINCVGQYSRSPTCPMQRQLAYSQTRFFWHSRRV